MNKLPSFLTLSLLTSTGWLAQADPTVTVDFHANDAATPAFTFKTVPAPSANNLAIAAKFTLVDGTADGSGGELDKLHDGQVPTEADQPAENFFFAAGSDGGRLQVDLGNPTEVRQVNTYSWHPSSRGPQIYKLYASDGTATNFNAAPTKETNPEQCGWKLLAIVNTKPATGDGGGQYGVSVANPDGALGNFRYLLFDVAATEHDDPFGNTFYSEIDVVGTNAPMAIKPPVAEKFTITTADGKSTIDFITTKAPGLKEWAQTKLAPALAEWYPKIADYLPSEGYTAPTHFSITFKPMPGVAYTAGTSVVANSDWISKEIGREAVGSLVHEAVHVVQQFGGYGDNPGWLVEGEADYVRWFKYEPQSHGADIVWMKHIRHFSPHYNDSYRITANFLNWVSEKYDPKIVPEMNAAMRDGKYDDSLWKQYTGHTAPELGDEWVKAIKAQLATPGTNAPAH